MKKLLLLLGLAACARPPLLDGRRYAPSTPMADGPKARALGDAPSTAMPDESAFPVLPRRPRHDLPIVDRRLPSGVRLVVEPDRSFPYVQLTVLVGRRREDPGPASQLVAATLQSWVRRWNGGRDIYDSGLISGGLHPDAITFTVSTLSGTFGAVGPRFLQRLTRSDFERYEIGRFSVWFAARDLGRTAGELGPLVLAEELYPAPNSYGQVQSDAGVLDDVSASEVESARRAMMVKDNLTIAAVGDVDVDALEKMIERELKTLAPTSKRVDGSLPPSRCEGKLSVIPHAGSSQAWVTMAWPAVKASHPDAPALRYLAAASGSTLSTRLNRSIRGALGASYGVRAHARLLHDDGTFEIEMALDPTKTRAALGQLDVDIETLRTSALEQAEIDAVGRRLRIVEGSTELALEHYRDETRSVPTAEDIERVAAKYLVKSKRCAVVVGDAKSLAL